MTFGRIEAPHICSDPSCPGHANRRKLELYEEMRAHILGTRCYCDPLGTCSRCKLLARADEIEKGER